MQQTVVQHRPQLVSFATFSSTLQACRPHRCFKRQLYCLRLARSSRQQRQRPAVPHASLQQFSQVRHGPLLSVLNAFSCTDATNQTPRQTAVTSCCQLVIPPPPQELLAQALQPAPGLGPAVAVNSAVFLLGIRVLLAGLMPSAVALSWVLGTAVYAAFGLGGYALICLYFVFGSAVRTSIQHNALQCAHIAVSTLQCKVHQYILQQPREARAVPGNIVSSTA